MKDLALFALEQAIAAGASYADVRAVSLRDESIRVRNGVVENLSSGESMGVGVRVITSGGWGFAGTANTSRDGLTRAAQDAVEIARASAKLLRAPIELSPVCRYVDSCTSPMVRDPFSISLDEKIGLLLACNSLIKGCNSDLISEGSLNFFKEEKVFASSVGSVIEQHSCESGAEISATAVGGGEVQRRTAGGNFAKAGWEWVAAMRLEDSASQIAQEATALLSAKQCLSGRTTLIIDPAQMALQIHESCGHPTELDRALGMEESLAGTSFLTIDKLGEFRYGSDLVNIVADATIPGALGSFAYDDDGVPAQRTPLIERGMFVNYMTSRETAPLIGESSNGTMRADSWSHIPLIRMTNVCLEPGKGSLQDLISEVDSGLLVSRNRSWSIDDRRLNFQFMAEIGWEIKNGRIAEMVKNPTYTGITPEFWASCDAIAGPEEWEIWGVPNCGKGEPIQVGHVGHGSSPARFRNVAVGVGNW